VIFFFDAIDEYLLQHLREFDGKQLVSAASSGLELGDDDKVEAEGETLSDDEMALLTEFLTGELGEKIENVSAGKRLVSSPAAVMTPQDGMTAQMRAMMQAMNPDEPLPPLKVDLELNPRHALIHQLSEARENNPDLAKLVAVQLLDNALLAAGLLENRTDLVSRTFRLMEEAMKK
jgi:molecular chaperone HtpG